MSSACKPTFYLGMGIDRTLMWHQGSWIPSDFALPAGTLLYGESCEEYKATGDGAKTKELSSSTHRVLHAIDLLCIDSLQLNRVPLRDRRCRLIELVDGWKDKNVRVRPIFPISEMLNYIERVRNNWQRVQGHALETLMFRTRDETYYPAGGLCFYRLTNGVQAIRSQPILWDWLTKTDDMLNWFKKRLLATN